MSYLKMKSTALLVLVFMSSASTHYVKPNNSPLRSCLDQPCFTLDQYTQQASTYFTTGSTFMFMAGNHTLARAVNFANVANITLKGDSDVTILCGNEILLCENVTGFVVSGLKFLFKNAEGQMSALKVLLSTDIVINFTVFQGSSKSNGTSERALYVSHSAVEVLNCLFEGNTGENGGAIYALSSSITLNSSKFINNRADRDGGAIYSQKSVLIMNGNLFKGNQAIYNGGAFSAEQGVVHINGNNFPRNISWDSSWLTKVGAAHFSSNTASNGGAVSTLGCNITFSGSAVVFSSNSAKYYGGALSSVGYNNYTVFRHGESYVTFEAYQMCFHNNTAGYSGGAVDLRFSSFTSQHSLITEFVANSANKGGAIYISYSQATGIYSGFVFEKNRAQFRGGAVFVDFFSEVTLSANFVNNTAQKCGAVDMLGAHVNFINIHATGNSKCAFCMYDCSVHFNGTTNINRNIGGAVNIYLQSFVSFTGHTVFDSNIADNGGAIYTSYAVVLVFDGSITFTRNKATVNGGALYALGANITFQKHSTIGLFRNSAQIGGAMYLSTVALLTFKEGISLDTAHNHAALYGGVFYHDDAATTIQCSFESDDEEDTLQLPFCFISFVLYFDGRYSINATVNSYNDSSVYGSFMYGGLFDRCRLQTKIFNLVPFDVLGEAFHFEGIHGVHTVTSQPYRLCFCSSHQYNFECTGRESVQIYRGQRFTTYLHALDQMKHATSTLVTAKVQGTARLKLYQSSQKLLPHCSNLTYSLFSTADSEELILYPDGPCRDTGLARAVVNVTLLPCPDGFKQSAEECVCEKRLQDYGAHCNIDEDIFITRGQGSRLWMSALYENSTYQGMVLYKTCPGEYCKTENVIISLHDPDIQCANNRSGVLCGACATNYSLMLGSSRCEECSNTYLALILPFAAAGTALVVFLSILRLTVAIGMLNSVILYANIIQVNRVIFFPPNTVNVLTVFIAWMNLDLGFETCFYNGMTAYAGTWLQFSFPIFVWMLILFVILASKYSLTVSKWIGHNPVAVLATLLLMSYTKILKIIIDVFSFVNLDYPDHVDTRWLKDANVDYLHAKHFVLSVVTLLVLVFFFLPFTLLLLLGYKFYRFSGKKNFRWFNRIKPLLDSYYAPYNKHTRYWPGFLLLVRCALYGIFSLGETNKSVLVITITFTLTLAYEQLLPWKVHSKSYNNIIEKVVYTNLVVLAATASAGVSTPALVYTLIGIVFTMMVSICIYQFHILYIAKSAIFVKLRALKSRPIEDPQETELATQKTTSTTVELREPLLDY